MSAQESRQGNPGRPATWVFLAALLVVVVALIGFLVAAARSGGTGSYGWGWMMGGAWGSMWLFGTLTMVIPVLLLVLLLALFLRPSTQVPVLVSPSPAADAASTVRLRYARGEITPEQYRQILSDLQRVS